MGVYANSDVDFSGIANEMGLTIAGWLNASVQIIDANSSESTWDVYTNTETTAEPTLIWEGRARIQPVVAYANPVVGAVEDSVRKFRVNVPLDPSAGAIRKGMQVIITNPGNDYELDGMTMTVTGAVNSSYAWARTIMCEADVRDGI